LQPKLKPDKPLADPFKWGLYVVIRFGLNMEVVSIILKIEGWRPFRKKRIFNPAPRTGTFPSFLLLRVGMGKNRQQL
jgi:hypothetical protein